MIRFTLVGQSASEVRRTIQAEGHQNDSELTFPLAKTGAISTSRIRRRRGEDVADTTGSLRAVACIRFVRLCLADGLLRCWHVSVSFRVIYRLHRQLVAGE